MRKTILTLAIMLMLALAATAAPTIKATPASKAHVAMKGDSVVVTDGDKSVTVSGLDLQKVNEKINEALDDTLTTGGTTVEIDGYKGELAPEDIKEISNQWASVAKQWAISGSFCLLGLVALVLFFRFLNRRNKYRVIEKAIENNYPLNELSLTDVKRSAIYVQQPVVTAAPPVQPGQVPVGTPLEGMAPQQPIIMTDMVNWRAMRPAITWLGWGAAALFCGIAIDGSNPFTPIGLALIFVGLCKGFIIYKEQKALQEAWRRAEQQRATQPQREPMREGIPVPPPMDEEYRSDDENQPYQPY